MLNKVIDAIEGIFKFAGKIRDYDITKKEWVLRGDTVLYVNSEDLRKALEYDLEQEKNFSYKGLSMDDVVARIAKFVSGIWQIHPFGEGNTRTTAVFTIKYLRSIGFDVNNDLFANSSSNKYRTSTEQVSRTSECTSIINNKSYWNRTVFVNCNTGENGAKASTHFYRQLSDTGYSRWFRYTSLS